MVEKVEEKVAVSGTRLANMIRFGEERIEKDPMCPREVTELVGALRGAGVSHELSWDEFSTLKDVVQWYAGHVREMMDDKGWEWAITMTDNVWMGKRMLVCLAERFILGDYRIDR